MMQSTPILCGAILAGAILACAPPSLAEPSGAAKTLGRPLQGFARASLADVLTTPQAGQEVRLEGTIDKVCRNKGCWLELTEGGRSVHVTFEGYSFFVPRDSAGKPVVLEGRVRIRQPKADEVTHLEKEGAGGAAGSRVSIEASSVQIAEAAPKKPD